MTGGVPGKYRLGKMTTQRREEQQGTRTREVLRVVVRDRDGLGWQCPQVSEGRFFCRCGRLLAVELAASEGNAAVCRCGRRVNVQRWFGLWPAKDVLPLGVGSGAKVGRISPDAASGTTRAAGAERQAALGSGAGAIPQEELPPSDHGLEGAIPLGEPGGGPGGDDGSPNLDWAEQNRNICDALHRNAR